MLTTDATFRCGECHNLKPVGHRSPADGTCWDCYILERFPCDRCGESVRYDSVPSEIDDTSPEYWLCPACRETRFNDSAPNL